MSAPASQSVDSRARSSFCKVTSVSILSFVEWLDTFSYVLRPPDMTVKEVNHIRHFAINIAKDLILLSCRPAMVFIWIRVAQFYAFWVVFCWSLLVLLAFLFWQFYFMSFCLSIYGFWQPICYFQTVIVLLKRFNFIWNYVVLQSDKSNRFAAMLLPIQESKNTKIWVPVLHQFLRFADHSVFYFMIWNLPYIAISTILNSHVVLFAF